MNNKNLMVLAISILLIAFGSEMKAQDYDYAEAFVNVTNSGKFYILFHKEEGKWMHTSGTYGSLEISPVQKEGVTRYQIKKYGKAEFNVDMFALTFKEGVSPDDEKFTKVPLAAPKTDYAVITLSIKGGGVKRLGFVKTKGGAYEHSSKKWGNITLEPSSGKWVVRDLNKKFLSTPVKVELNVASSDYDEVKE